MFPRKNDPFKNFDRNFKIMRGFVLGWIAFVAVLIFGGIGTMIYLGPNGMARVVGQMVGTAQSSYEDARSNATR